MIIELSESLGSFPLILTTWKSFSKKLIEIYASSWKILVFLIFFREILLDVRLAIQPFSNSSLAFAISGVVLIISWIIKSIITETSVPLGLKSESLCDSINFGFLINSLQEINAWLYLSTNPTWPIILFFFANSFITLASLEFDVRGFSTNMCFPASIHFFAISKWVVVGDTITAASILFINRSKSLKYL